MLAVSFVFLILPYTSGEVRYASSSAARAEAQRLIERVVQVSEGNPSDPGASPSWKGSKAGEPLLVKSVSGIPFEYIIPVISKGETISTVGVDAKCGKWRWYSLRYIFNKFPPVDCTQAKRRAEDFLKKIGLSQKVSGGEAVSAPDKVLYWHFTTSSSRVSDIYIPLLVESEPLTNLDCPWNAIGKNLLDGGKNQVRLKGEDIDAPVAKDSPGKGESKSHGFTQGASYGGSNFSLPAAHNIENVPYHSQETNYTCGAASLEMIFDYWGPDISQDEIASVANSSPSYGAYASDIVRASHFSYISTSIQDPNLHGYSNRLYGYATSVREWSDVALVDRRYTDLKHLIASDLPVLVLSYYDGSHSTTHFRVAKGYSDPLGVFIFHDPWYSGSISGPDCALNQTFFVDDLWTYSDRWGMLALPWTVEVSKPTVVTAGQVFQVTATVTYPGPEPMNGQYDVTEASAQIDFSPSYELAGGSMSQPLDGISTTGTMAQTSWTLRALESKSSTDDIRVVASGKVNGSSRSYSSYTDLIGGYGVGGTPPFQPTSRTWAHDSIGVVSPKVLWYLAEGSTGKGFETWILVQNPGNETATVSLKYMTSAGEVAGPVEEIPPHTRKTFNVAATVSDTWEVSTFVSSDKPIIVERAMYGDSI